ncbi:hypothetical protein SAMN04488544_0254 [Microlunatus sagamiharensis]|uniref:Tat (Twin-arginine translocation) pathway signal sequence n=1 Tax=Microlunatus sagamiharensis TaxID=546874 RepID=A0A1H2LIN4_9ACTN|nr:hypothetical protein [Microlunatus sagamiharensis]SDU80769.1 hypothetical protein SAMN04488544_0254 [Microlunatus sagamiharensis]
MTDPVPSADDAALQRRRFLRGGALLAAAAGGAVAASASSALPAAAAEPVEYVRLGGESTSSATTALSTSGADLAALQVSNPLGAALRLVPVGENIPEYYGLPLGSVVNTEYGPFISVADEDRGSFMTYLVTGEDLVDVPRSRAFTPTRAWDSKKKQGTVVGTSGSGALDSKGRLVKGHWVDVKVADTDLDTYPIAAFVTLGSSGSTKDGYLNVWGSGNRPSGTISLSFLKGKTLSGAAYSQLALNRGKKAFTVRVYASQTTYVTLDVSGLTAHAYPGPDFGDDSARRGVQRGERTRQSRTSAPR